MTFDRRAVESLLAFWSEAGVDACYADTPRGGASPAIEAGIAQPTKRRTDPTRPNDLRPSDRAKPLAEVDGRRFAREAVDLVALEAAVAAFDGCALKAGATRCVFARGDADASIMVIGEAPGAEEDAQGRPFVGRAGKLLDKMLSAAGLAGRAFVTNTVFWRPPGNRLPTVAEQLACAPFLERSIALVRPKALLLVGGAAVKSMLRQSEGILSLRGRWFEWRSEDGGLEIPALPTLHPAFLLRQPSAKKKAWRDMISLVERVDRPERPA